MLLFSSLTLYKGPTISVGSPLELYISDWLLAAWLFLFVLFANKNTKTLSGKMVYPIADLFIVQWEEMKKLYPKAVYGGAIY